MKPKGTLNLMTKLRQREPCREKTMNKLEPVISFIDERIAQLRRRCERVSQQPMPVLDVGEQCRIEELQMIRNLCTGLIEQDKLLQNALDGAVLRK